MTALIALTDNELAVNIAHCKQELAAFEGDVARRRKEKIEQEIEVWFAANPDQIRFKIGDKLLVTKALFDLRERDGGWPKSRDGIRLGKVCEVEGFDTVTKGCWWIKIDGSSTGLIPAEVIQDMRRAYLASIDHKEAGNG